MTNPLFVTRRAPIQVTVWSLDSPDQRSHFEVNKFALAPWSEPGVLPAFSNYVYTAKRKFAELNASHYTTQRQPAPGSADAASSNAPIRGMMFYDPIAGLQVEPQINSRMRTRTDFMRAGRFVLLRFQCTEPFAIHRIELSGSEATHVSNQRDSAEQTKQSAVSPSGWLLPSMSRLPLSIAEFPTNDPMLESQFVIEQWDGRYPSHREKQWASMTLGTSHRHSIINTAKMQYDPKFGAYRLARSMDTVEVDVTATNVPDLSIECWIKPVKAAAAAAAPAPLYMWLVSTRKEAGGLRSIVLHPTAGGVAVSIGGPPVPEVKGAPVTPVASSSSGVVDEPEQPASPVDVPLRAAPLVSNSFPFDQWMHLVVTFGASECTLYVNGMLVSAQTTATVAATARAAAARVPASTSARVLTLGGVSGDALENRFDGWLSQLILWGRVLTRAEALDRFNRSAARYELVTRNTGPVAHAVGPDALTSAGKQQRHASADPLHPEMVLCDYQNHYPFAYRFLRTFRLWWAETHPGSVHTADVPTDADKAAEVAFKNQVEAALGSADELMRMPFWDALETGSWIVFGVPFFRPNHELAAAVQSLARDTACQLTARCPAAHLLNRYTTRPPSAARASDYTCSVCKQRYKWTQFDFYYCDQCNAHLTCALCAQQQAGSSSSPAAAVDQKPWYTLNSAQLASLRMYFDPESEKRLKFAKTEIVFHKMEFFRDSTEISFTHKLDPEELLAGVEPYVPASLYMSIRPPFKADARITPNPEPRRVELTPDPVAEYRELFTSYNNPLKRLGLFSKAVAESNALATDSKLKDAYRELEEVDAKMQPIPKPR
jgi:hypothetical protein